jgi:hypothetical protein
MLDTVSTGVMSAMARMYLIVMGFLQRFIIKTATAKASSH